MNPFTAPAPATLFVALLYPKIDPADCVRALVELFGPVVVRSPGYLMSEFSRYYEREMGPQLQKEFLAFERPVAMDRLAGLKLATYELERKFLSASGGRTFNIDPGLVTGYSVILATSKNHSHRIYLGDGVFAEVTLVFRERQFHSLPWTYPDYCAPRALQFFAGIRARP